MLIVLSFFFQLFWGKINSVRACSSVLSNSSTPWTAAYQAPLFMEFSRQENWHVCMLSCFSHVWLYDPMDCSPPSSYVHGLFQARILDWLAISSFRKSSYPGTEPMSWFSCIGKQTLYHWTTWEAQLTNKIVYN